MYHSRYHFDNSYIHLAIDSHNGQILELCDGRTGENLMKNSMFDLPQPFTIRLRVDGKEVELAPPHERVAFKDPSMRCEISSEETSEGLCVKVHYPRLWDGETVYPLQFTYTATLCGDQIHWNSKVENATEYTVTQVRFPVLNGIWLSDTWKNNVLYYPRFAGERYENPTEYLAAQAEVVYWRWQGYRYAYFTHGMWPAGELTARGLRGRALQYAGALSMAWMELDDPTRGLYFGCHDPKGRPCVLEAGAMGEESPGVCLAASFAPRVKPGENWENPTVVTRVHEGDWHRGAELYRSFRQPLLPQYKPRPRWMGKSRALFAHYDFKYQNGGVVHRYCDIPALAKKAKEMGVYHLLLSGWHKDGFDCGFPMYVTDDDLGTEQDFIQGVKAAKEMGVHTTLYMNIRIHNRAYQADTIDHKAVMAEDGTIPIETYGNPDLKFSIMCPGSRMWQEEIGEAVRRATEVYGIDGVYFDQLAAGCCLCFHPEHDHDFDAWCDGYLQILDNVENRFQQTQGDSLCLMGEWTCDLFGTRIDLALNQTYFNHHGGGFVEMYRYTFPDHGVVDMLYPTRNMAMRPVHVAQSAKEIMSRVFCSGSYFWMYDLEEDNTFSRDPVGTQLLKEVLALSRLREELMPGGLYCHTEGIAYSAEKVQVSRFVKEDKQLLCVYAMENGADVQVQLKQNADQAVFYDAQGSETVLSVENGVVSVPAKTGLVLLENRK